MKNKDPHLLSNLPAYGEDGSVHAVVESPKGSPVKLKFEIKLGAFTVAHSLPLGLSYPFDWGFVPSTQASGWRSFGYLDFARGIDLSRGGAAVSTAWCRGNGSGRKGREEGKE